MLATDPPSDPPQRALRLVIPPPHSRALLSFLRRANTRTLPAPDLLRSYFELKGGDAAEHQEQALLLLGCLLDEKRGYLEPVRFLAQDWRNAAYGRYDTDDLVAATLYEMVLALERPSGRDVLETGWKWFCRNSFDRARAQADLNGKQGSKSKAARAVKDAQKQLARVLAGSGGQPGADGGGLDDREPEDFTDDAAINDGAADEDPQVVNPAPEPAEPPHAEDADDPVSVSAEPERFTLANEMALALAQVSEHVDYTTYDWLTSFIEGYLVAYPAADPARRAVAEAILRPDPTPTSGKPAADGRPPLVEALGLTRDRVNDLIKQERTRFRGALVAAAEKSTEVSDGFVRTVLDRS